MSVERGKKLSLIQTSKLLRPSLNKLSTQEQFFVQHNNQKLLPALKVDSCSSNKNLLRPSSKTIEVNAHSEQSQQRYIKKVRRKYSKNSGKLKTSESLSRLSKGEGLGSELRRQPLLPHFDQANLKKYGSCNKLTFIPDIHEVLVSHEELHFNHQTEAEIRSMNSIKAVSPLNTKEHSQYIKKHKVDRAPLKRLIKSNKLSKTINPSRKTQSQNSIELQNEPQKENFNASKKLERNHAKQKESHRMPKVFVKNPFERLMFAQQSNKRQTQEIEQKLQTQFGGAEQGDSQLSKIVEDAQNESKISFAGEQQMHDLISLIH